MPVQILDHPTIHTLLISLPREETTSLLHKIQQALESFSAHGERKNQPPPSAVTRPNTNTLFRPFTSATSVGTKITAEPVPDAHGKKAPLHGVIVLCDVAGLPTGLLASEEITGYRTSMTAMVPFVWRRDVADIVVFGAGVQALWHTRLILMLRGDEVRRITFVSPRRESVDELIRTVSNENRVHGWTSTSTGGCVFDFVSSAASPSELETRLRTADCVFCTTPARNILFPAEYVTKRDTGTWPLVSAVGSWQSEMIELDPALLHHAIDENPSAGGQDMYTYNPITGQNKGAILTDDRDFALGNCGEMVRADVAREDVVELGEIIALRKGRETGESGSLSLAKVDGQRMDRFSEEGLVVFKSVGVSLTDLAAGNAVLDLFRLQRQLHRL